MSFEKPPQNPGEKAEKNPLNDPEKGRFKRMPEEGNTPEEQEELDKKFEKANARLEEQEKNEEVHEISEEDADENILEKEQTNESFLEKNPEIKQVLDEYEKQLGEDFSQHKDEIVEKLKESAPEKNEDELKGELTEMIREKLNPAA